MEIFWSIITLILIIINISICSATSYYMTDIYRLGAAIPVVGNKVITIDILDRMTIIMDITIYSFPNNEYQNIFHIGNVDTERFPGIWLLNNLNGFHICFSNTNSWNDCQNIQISGNLQLNTKYNVKIEFSQSEYRIYIDNVIQYENVNYPTHSVLTSRSVYIGHPFGSKAANVKLENLKIQKIANLCIGYTEGTDWLRGSSFTYYGEKNGKPHWKETTTEHSIHIDYNNWYRQWVISSLVDDALGFSEVGDDAEVDSFYGASWTPYQILISATLCGWRDSNESQIQNIYVVPIPYTFIYSFIVIVSLVLIIYFIIKRQKKEFINTSNKLEFV